MTRRWFAQRLALAAASLLLLPASLCNKAGDLISSLRNILATVEHALGLLGVLQGLLPDAVNTAAKYLIAVVSFVDSVGQIMENDTLNAADKARQILALAGPLVFPPIPPPIGPILQAVAKAVDAFLSHFGTDQAHAGAQARAVPGNVPDMSFNQKQRDELEAIEQQARKDRVLIEDWQKRAMAQPH